MLSNLLQFVAVASVLLLVPGTPTPGLETCGGGDGECPRGDSLVQKVHSVKRSSDTIGKEEVQAKDNASKQVPSLPFELPPISTSMKCVISVTVQYFLVWTSLAIVTGLPKLCGPSETLTNVKSVLDDACTTVKFAPMISILLIATRMRAIMLTKGETEKYGLPPDWCKDGMVVCATCVGIITIATIVQRAAGTSALECLMAIQYLAMIIMYVGFAVVSFGLYSMDTPKELGESVPVSTTANCVMGLTVIYFVAQILRQISTTCDMLESQGDKKEGGAMTIDKSTFTKTAEAALKALDYAPMVCILFLAARMRSLQMGLEAPQLWARIYFSITYYSIIALMILAAAKVMLQAHKAKIIAVETFCLLVLYVSITCVLISIFTIEAPDGKPTPPISTTVRIVMMFTGQYFILYMLEWLFEQLHDLGMMASRFVVDLFKKTQETVMFCPMLACLFVATRMQALQMTKDQGAPQGWVQDCMMLTQWAIVLQLILVVIEHFSGDEGSAGVVSTVGRNICIILLHGGVIGVIKGIFDMRPENANGQGQLIAGFAIPGRLSV